MRRGALLGRGGLALLAPAPAARGGTKHFGPRKRLVRGRQPLAIGDLSANRAQGSWRRSGRPGCDSGLVSWSASR